MTKRRATLLTSVCALLAGCLANGCRPELSPSEDAVLYYFRNARLLHYRTEVAEGQVRRVWPEGQKYVNAVLKADAALQKKLKPLRDLDDPASLWTREDPRWRDAKQVAKQVGTLVMLVEAEQAERATLLDKLGKAIEQTPAGLDFATPNAKAGFIAKAWDALALYGISLRRGAIIESLEESVGAHGRLFRAVQASAGDFDPDQPGLSFKDAGRQQEIDRHYDAVHVCLRAHRERFLIFAEEQLVLSGLRLNEIDKRGQRDEYNYLTHKDKYLRDELRAIPKGLQASGKSTEEELKLLRKRIADGGAAKKTDQLREGFLTRRIEQLKVEEQEWRARIDAILERAEQAAERTDTANG